MSGMYGDDPHSEEPLRIPITDSLDLHTFRPHEVKDLVEEYLNECVQRGFHEVRIIHGKGTGALRTKINQQLEQDERVRSHEMGELYEGGAGVTVVEMNV